MFGLQKRAFIIKPGPRHNTGPYSTVPMFNPSKGQTDSRWDVHSIRSRKPLLEGARNPPEIQIWFARGRTAWYAHQQGLSLNNHHMLQNPKVRESGVGFNTLGPQGHRCRHSAANWHATKQAPNTHACCTVKQAHFETQPTADPVNLAGTTASHTQLQASSGHPTLL